MFKYKIISFLAQSFFLVYNEMSSCMVVEYEFARELITLFISASFLT